MVSPTRLTYREGNALLVKRIMHRTAQSIVYISEKILQFTLYHAVRTRHKIWLGTNFVLTGKGLPSKTTPNSCDLCLTLHHNPKKKTLTFKSRRPIVSPVLFSFFSTIVHLFFNSNLNLELDVSPVASRSGAGHYCHPVVVRACVLAE